jgi:two-component system, response regulator RegA
MSEHQPCVLIVDDDRIFAEILARALRKRGYTTLVAHTLTQAHELAINTVPDFAVIDLKIEQESGLDCLPCLQQINPAIRMLILTGYSSIATAVSAIKRGAIDYACKPLNADEILALLIREKSAEQAATVSTNPPSVGRLEWEHIQRLLQVNNGNISATARSLGMHRRTLQRKLQKRPLQS